MSLIDLHVPLQMFHLALTAIFWQKDLHSVERVYVLYQVVLYKKKQVKILKKPKGTKRTENSQNGSEP